MPAASKSSRRSPARMASPTSSPTPRSTASSSTGRWGRTTAGRTSKATELLRTVRARNAKVPVFLMADRDIAGTITIEVATMADEFIWVLEDTAAFIAGRTVAAIERYIQSILPPFAAALARYDREREYSWAAPGHQGGVAFLKSAGRPRVLRLLRREPVPHATWGSSAPRSGSLLGHTGPSARASDTPRASSARTAPTRCSTAPRAPIGPSCRPASATPRSRSATATATSPSSRGSCSPAGSPSS